MARPGLRDRPALRLSPMQSVSARCRHVTWARPLIDSMRADVIVRHVHLLIRPCQLNRRPPDSWAYINDAHAEHEDTGKRAISSPKVG